MASGGTPTPNPPAGKSLLSVFEHFVGFAPKGQYLSGITIGLTTNLNLKQVIVILSYTNILINCYKSAEIEWQK